MVDEDPIPNLLRASAPFKQLSTRQETQKAVYLAPNFGTYFNLRREGEKTEQKEGIGVRNTRNMSMQTTVLLTGWEPHPTGQVQDGDSISAFICCSRPNTVRRAPGVGVGLRIRHRSCCGRPCVRMVDVCSSYHRLHCGSARNAPTQVVLKTTTSLRGGFARIAPEQLVFKNISSQNIHVCALLKAHVQYICIRFGIRMLQAGLRQRHTTDLEKVFFDERS
jgi:hypothetical protein